MTSHVIPLHGEHGAAVVGLEDVARRQIDLAGVVDAAAGRQRAGRVAILEGKEVRHLLTLRVDDPEHVATLQAEPMAGLGCDPALAKRVQAAAFRAWKGQPPPSLPEYC